MGQSKIKTEIISVKENYLKREKEYEYNINRIKNREVELQNELEETKKQLNEKKELGSHLDD